MNKDNKGKPEEMLAKVETELEKTEESESLKSELQTITKKQKELYFKISLNEAVDSKVNKAMLKKIMHQWTTLIVLIGLFTVYLFIIRNDFNTLKADFKTDFNTLKADFKTDFSRLENQISNMQYSTKRKFDNIGPIIPETKRGISSK